MEEVRLIILNHGEDILTAYIRILKKHLDDKINKLKEQIENSHAADIKALSETQDNPLSSSFYSSKKEAILKGLEPFLISGNYKLLNPGLSEKGSIQTFYSGKMLKAYLEQENLKSARLAFSAPSMSTLDGLQKKVLESYKYDKSEIVIVPHFIKTKQQYKKEEFESEEFESYEVLDDDFNPMKVLSTDSNEIVVGRFKKGLEQLFLKNKETSEEGVPIVMIHDSILDKFFKIFLKEDIGEIKDSAAYDVTISFNEDGTFESVNLNNEIQMDANLSTSYNDELRNLTPLPTNDDDYNEALIFINKEITMLDSEIMKKFFGNNTNKNNAKDKSTNKKKIEKKVSFKEDIEKGIKDFLKEGIKEILKGAKEDIKRNKEEAKENFKVGIEYFFKEAKEGIKKDIEKGIEKGIEDFLNEIKEGIGTGIQDFLNEIKEDIEKWIQYCLDEIKEDIKISIQDLLKEVKEDIEISIQDLLREAKEDIEKGIQEGIQEVTQDFLNGITEYFLKEARQGDILGVFDGITLQKNQSPTGDSKIGHQESVAAASSVNNLSELATSPIPYNPVNSNEPKTSNNKLLKRNLTV